MCRGAACPGSIQTARNRRAVARLITRAHRLFGARLGTDLFKIPAWDMLLDLYASEDQRPMSLSSLCAASSSPARTAFRAIDALVARRLVIRVPDPQDRRRVNVRLSPRAVRLLDRYCDDLRILLRHD